MRDAFRYVPKGIAHRVRSYKGLSIRKTMPAQRPAHDAFAVPHSHIKAGYANAQNLAMQSWQQGTRQGRLCERNWQVIIEVRRHNQDTAGVENARRRQQACRKGGE